MRYSARRQWEHPVLRPGSDDYPQGYKRDESAIDPPQLLPDGSVELSIKWQPSLKTVQEKMEAGEAVLCGLVYCQATYFRATMEALPTDPYRAVVRVDAKEMRGRIEVHPLIVAKIGRVELGQGELHEEYEGTQIVLRRGAPLAVDQYWSLEHDPTKPPLESFVQLHEDKSVEEGSFVLSGEIGDRQLVIHLHPDTYQEFNRIRTEPKARAGLYLPALTAACQRIAKASVAEDPEEGTTDSWNAVVDRLLAKPDLEVGYSPCYIARISPDIWDKEFFRDLEEVEPEEAAQRLLGAPIGAMLERVEEELGDTEE